jgi:dynein light intermediate chain 1
VPPNWDSWGKIRVLREGFDVEAVNKGWSVDIEEYPEPASNGHTNGSLPKETVAVPGGAVTIYEETIRDPSLDALQAVTATETNGLKLEVSSLDAQSFLATQLEVLEKIRSEASGMDSTRQAGGRQTPAALDMGIDGQEDEREGRVNEHIGPVQFNMGGIQVDADDMLQRLKVCFEESMVGCDEMLMMYRIDKPTQHPNQQRPVASTLQTANRRTKHWPLSSQVS